MQASLNAVLSKWDNINNFLVPVTANNREPYYEVAALFYMLVALKVSLCDVFFTRARRLTGLRKVRVLVPFPSSRHSHYGRFRAPHTAYAASGAHPATRRRWNSPSDHTGGPR